MQTLPKISIVIPSYQQGEFLEETLCSILNQQYPNLQLIVIDGASTDNSVDIIKKYEHSIDYWVSEKDQGQSEAINKGLKRCNGQLVSFLNSDDVLLPNSLATVARLFNAKQPQIITGPWLEGKNINEAVRREILSPLTLENFILNIGLFAQPGTFWTFSNALLLDENYHFCLDFEFFYRLMRAGYQITPSENTLALFRLHPQAKTSLKQITKYQELISFFKKNIPVHPEIANKMQLLLDRNRRTLYRLELLDRWKNAKKTFLPKLWEAIKYDPRVLIKGI